MLGILLLYFIAKPFYKMAERHDKNKWLFAICSVLIYYLGSFIGGALIAVVSQFGFNYPIDQMEDILIGVMAMPFGLLAAWGFFKYLERKWENDLGYEQQDILDENINL